MEIYNGGNVVAFPFDPWNVDLVGVLSGPASVLYGTGAIGGAVNVVPRRPDPAQRRNEIQFGAGRFGTYHEAIDSTGPLSPGVSYRFDASLYNSDHWVERGQSNSQAVSGSLRFDATNNLRFTISNDFGNQNPSKYLGTPVVNNAPVPGPRYVNYNVLDAKLNFTGQLDQRRNDVDAVAHPLGPQQHVLPVSRAASTTTRPTTPTCRRRTRCGAPSFRDINNTYETQYGDTGYLKQTSRVFGLQNDVLIGRRPQPQLLPPQRQRARRHVAGRRAEPQRRQLPRTSTTADDAVLPDSRESGRRLRRRSSAPHRPGLARRRCCGTITTTSTETIGSSSRPPRAATTRTAGTPVRYSSRSRT